MGRKRLIDKKVIEAELNGEMNPKTIKRIKYGKKRYKENRGKR